MTSSKNKTVALILCILLGWLGAHRFYTGKIKTGILYLFTVGLFGFGWIYDIFEILGNRFKDSNGAYICKGTVGSKPSYKKITFWIVLLVCYALVFSGCPSKSGNKSKDQKDQAEVPSDISANEDVETPDSPRIIDLCDTDTDYREYSMLLDNSFSTNKTYHLDEDCPQLKYVSDEKIERVTVKTPSVQVMEQYFENNHTSPCYQCVDLGADRKEDSEVAAQKEREAKTKEIELSSDSDAEIFEIVVDTDESVYHISETCTAVKYEAEDNKVYYKIKASDIHEIDDYFISHGIEHCVKCVKITSSNTSSEEVKEESKVESSQSQRQMSQYVFYGNKDSMCYHTEMCTAAEKISDDNRFTYIVNAYSLYDAKQEAIQYFESQGYQLCGICAQ